MTNDTRNTTRLEQRAREIFDASVDGIDARTRSRLAAARHAATAHLDRSRVRAWRSWAPAGALAAAVIAAIVLWQAPVGDAPVPQQARTAAAPDALELVAAGDDLELVSEDLDFYEFVEQQTGAAGNGNG